MPEHPRPRHMPPAYILLFEAVDLVGKDMFPADWSEEERKILKPPTSETEIRREIDRVPLQFVGTSHQPTGQDIRKDIEEWDEPNRRRWDANERLRNILRNARIPAFAFRRDGDLVPIVPTNWDADDIDDVFMSGRVLVIDDGPGEPKRSRACGQQTPGGCFVLLVKDHVERALRDEQFQVESTESRSGAPGDITKQLTHTGDPGRPTPKQLYIEEYERRLGEGLCNEVFEDDVVGLQDWFKTTYAGLPLPAINTMRNNLRSLRRNHKRPK